MAKTFIIAEAGVNHNGDVALARRLVDAARDAGADAIKFQSFRPEAMVASTAPKAQYQKRWTDADETQLDMLRRLALSEEAQRELAAYSRERHITFLSSPFDCDSADLLVTLHVPLLKIPSGEITNLPLLRHVGKLGLPLILSTGMATLGEIEAAIEGVEHAGTARRHITLLHCNTDYPTRMQDVNLRAMATLRRAFDVRVGYSDHTLGIEVAIAAVALGAEVIEKHLTLDNSFSGPDHKASLEPASMAAMVAAIRNIDEALGSSRKSPTPSELQNRDAARKSLVALREIRAGERFGPENITAKRPGSGISPMRWDEIIGRTARRDFPKDELIEI